MDFALSEAQNNYFVFLYYPSYISFGYQFSLTRLLVSIVNMCVYELQSAIKAVVLPVGRGHRATAGGRG